MAGGQGQNRTADTVIFSHVLYQLSYLGTRGECAADERVVQLPAGRSGPAKDF